MFGFGFVWWLLRWSFAIACFVAVMAASGYYVVNEVLAGGEYVTVPDIVGKSYLEAGDLLARSNLVMGPQTPVQTDKVPENYVLHQMPAAGKVVRAGRKVYPSVSRMDTEMTPNLVGQSLSDALAMLEKAQLRPSTTIARVPNRAPADTVVGQDPGPDRTVPRGSEIQLLVSDGMGSRRLTVYMPDLSGMSPEQAAHELAPLNVDARPIKVDGTEPPFDVVIGQRPEPGTELTPGRVVTYEVRTNAPLPGAWRKVTVAYTIPPFWMEREVRMDVVYKDGTRKTAFPQMEQYVDGLPPKYQPGTTIRQPLPFQDELTVEIYLDGTKVRSYYYEGDAPPVIRDFSATLGETSSASA